MQTNLTIIILECLIIFLFRNYNKKKKELGHVLIITSIIICIQTARCQKKPFGRNRYTQNRGRNSVKAQLQLQFAFLFFFIFLNYNH